MKVYSKKSVYEKSLERIEWVFNEFKGHIVVGCSGGKDSTVVMELALEVVRKLKSSGVLFVDIDKIEPNDYNPNAVAKQEMKLLETSIDHDGYTQPTVTIYDKDRDKYVIIDGFHRYYVMKTSKLINERNNGKLPIVVLDKNINERMASTVRHNRARGKHSLTGMGNIVMSMVNNGMTDEDICNELGLETDELI